MNARTTSGWHQSWSHRITLAALSLWGAIHVLGGAALLSASASDGLDTLAPESSVGAPSIPGDGTEALLYFHALNVALGGAAVGFLAVAWWRSHSRWQRDVALAIAAGLDIGLIAFLVGPGLLPPSQGLIGPTLVVVSLVAAITANPSITFIRREPS